jgi:ankyrin repeat protein
MSGMVEQADELLSSIARGDRGALESLLETGADANARDRWGATALYHAAAKGDEAAVHLLLAHGADVNKTSDVGNSPLMAAAGRGHVAVVRLLLQHGTDPEVRNKWGLGAADWARWAPEPAEVLALLHGAAQNRDRLESGSD